MSLEGSSAHLSWTEPRDTGNAPITNYVIEYKPISDVRWRCANVGKPCTSRVYTVENLAEGSEIEFRISAENKAGVGPTSTPSKSVLYGVY